MANRSKGTRTGSELSDAARPDDRVGDELDETSDDPDRLLAEGEPVGPWSDDEEEDNAFDAADRDADKDEDDPNAPVGYQAGGQAPRGRRGH